MGKEKARVRDWKGLLGNESRRTKLEVFLALTLLASSMVFMQFGFIGMGFAGDYLCYVLGLLGPIAAASLLLGKGAGTLFGLISGVILAVHARVQPLDLVERYFVPLGGAVILYTLVGLHLGLLFAVALHNAPQGKRRPIYLALVCLGTSLFTSVVFFANMILSLVLEIIPNLDAFLETELISADLAGAVTSLGDLSLQFLFDFLLMFLVSLLCDRIVHKREQTTGHVGLRTMFRTRLFVVVTLVFCLTQAVSFALITIGAEHAASTRMKEELDFITSQVAQRTETHNRALEAASNYDIPSDAMNGLLSYDDVDGLFNAYSLSDGTIILFRDNVVAYTSNPAYPRGARVSDLFSTFKAGTLEELASTGELRDMVYGTPAAEAGETTMDLFSSAQLGYMRVAAVDNDYVMLAIPASAAFENRQATMGWASLLALALVAAIYLLATRLLSQNVVGPIDRTNASLALITSGNLDEVVSETESEEFASLSAGINETVASLKGLIQEAERRNERDLAVAKRIQESALPRVFPPFPEVGAFDIFAAMDAAKEVGGDFFDFFLIDDHTLGFLIADVSGKGIPGALFMMAAKTEIENYLSTGMEPAQAIASANRRLCANNDAGMFVTVWAATLEWETGLLTYVNAGHNFPLLRHGSGGEWEWLKKKCGLFLGTFETAKYRQETITLEPGDELLLYTDGVNEAFDPQEKEYGNDRLEAFVASHATMHPRELVRGLRADVGQWANGAEQSDDVTILALEYGVAPEVTGSITVDATLDHLVDAVSLVNAELEARLCPADVQHKVEVALEELFVNVCRYAYEGQEEPGKVQVSYAYGTDPSSITVELRDQGVPFDPVRKEDPTKPSSVLDTPIGGLGILMVKRTMDDLAYIRDGNENVVVFRKGW